MSKRREPWEQIKISTITELKISDLSWQIDIEDVFKFVKPWQLLRDNIQIADFFGDYFGTGNLGTFIDEACLPETSISNQIIDETISNNDIRDIEIYYEIIRYKNRQVDVKHNYIDAGWKIHGLGTYQGKPDHFALDFTPLNKLANLDVKISHTTKHFPPIGERHPHSIDEWIGTPTPTLFQVFECIIDDCTFWGSPQKRLDTLDELHRRIKEIDLPKEKEHTTE